MTNEVPTTTPAATGPPATTTLAPELAPDAIIRFIDAHRPALQSGDYTVHVDQPIGTHASISARPLAFRVAGPRFSLAPDEVHSVFPPPGVTGRFSRVLPHIVLTRSSLPWERTAAPTGSPTWLAVVIVAAASERVRVQTLGSLRPGAAHPPLAARSAESGDDPDERVRVLTVSAAQLPSFGDLPWLAHVRSVDSVAGAVETATVVADRLPAAGIAHRAHLVSIEGLYDGAVPSLTAGALATGLDDVDIDVVSLYSWDFVSMEEDGHGFVELLTTERFTVDDLRRFPPPEVEGVTDFFISGWVPLDHHLRQGADVTSWYHGPLSVAGPAMTPELPVQRSDQLVVYDDRSWMLDVSYAAAWELGRLLALQNPRVGQGIHAWKRAQAHHDRHEEQRTGLADLPQLHPAPRVAPAFVFGDWFTTQLSRLAAVPFRYLVPDDGMVPNESLRFFEVDHEWLRCLHDGAFSMGRTSAAQVDADRDLAAVLPPIESLSGFLLRSQVVTMYPGLMIDVDGRRPSDGAEASPLRIDHLAPDLLLVLVDGSLSAVTLHLHPQVLHFGVTDAEVGPNDTVSLAQVAAGRALAHAGELAAALVVPVPQVRFVRGGHR